MNLDAKLFYVINSLAGHSALWDKILVLSNTLALPFFGLIVLWYLFKNRRIFWQTVLSALLAKFGITELIRYFYVRPRPFLVLSNVHELIEKDQSEPSFPSGHASIYFGIAFVIYLYDRKLGTIMLVMAAVLSLTRIYLGVHYPLDILGGVVTGIVSAVIVYRLFKIKNKNR